MKRIFSDPGNYTNVYVDDAESYYLYTLCSNVGWFTYCIRMTEDEIASFKESARFAVELSAQVCRNWPHFADRRVPEDFAKQHGMGFS